MRRLKTLYVYVELKDFDGHKLLEWEGTISNFVEFYEEILSKFG